MNSFFRWATALIFGGLIAYIIWSKEDVENSVSNKPLQRKYGSIFSPDLLMLFFLTLFIYTVLKTDGRVSFETYFTFIFGIFISIAVFFALFMFLLPVLRKYVSAKAIAMIWLLPNYLYIIWQSYMDLAEPKFVVDIGNISLRTVSLIWLAGTAIVFIVYIIRHIIFRYKLLHHAEPVGSGAVRSLWETMQTEYEFKKPCIKIVISDHTSTPLSIGLFLHTTILVLPEKTYSEEELKLIFKHELIHIIRSDSRIKLFIAFCNALCWFNPLMWIAMKKCTEDLELSCDEYVIEDCSMEEKGLYADLILSAAGNEAGFTTCLSASAGALKYRLTNIFKPKRRFGGGIFVGMMMAVMLLTSGRIALTYNHQTMADVFGKNVKTADMDSESISLKEGHILKTYSCDNPEALNRYIMDLKVCELSGNYKDADNDGRCLYTDYLTDEGLVIVCIKDKVITYNPMYKAGRQDGRMYFLDETVDWDRLLTMISAE